MSHTVKIKAQFKNEHLQSFLRALEHFGWTTKENSKIRTYYSDSAANKVYDMIAVNPNTGYDLGLVFNKETGELEVMGDFFDGSVAKTLGNNLDKLKQEYSCCVIEDKLAFEGYAALRQVNTDGTVDIIAEQ
jgi:hypothetical protein